MQEKESIAWAGRICVVVRQSSVETVYTFENLVTNAGRNLLVSALRTASADAGVRFVALGSGATPPTGVQTQLVSEQFRKAVTRQEVGVVGELLTTVFISPTEANTFTINEIGWFAGPTATAAVNSGVMLARVLWTRIKNNRESIQIDRRDILG